MGRPKLDKVQTHWRVKPSTIKKFNQIAILLDYTHGGQGAVGELMDAIADGDYTIVPTKQLSSK